MISGEVEPPAGDARVGWFAERRMHELIDRGRYSSPSDFMRGSGVSTRSWHEIFRGEDGLRADVYPRAQRRLEWPEGTFDTLRRGDPLPEEDPAPELEARIADLEAEMRHQIRELWRAVELLRDAVASALSERRTGNGNHQS